MQSTLGTKLLDAGERRPKIGSAAARQDKGVGVAVKGVQIGKERFTADGIIAL